MVGGDVGQPLVGLLGAAEPRERPRLPVLRGHPRTLGSAERDPSEPVGRCREVSREVANPARTPSCLGREWGAWKPVGEAAVGGEGIPIPPGLLVDTPARVERLGGLRARREAAGHLPEQLEGGLVVIGIPAPRGRGEERLGGERIGWELTCEVMARGPGTAPSSPRATRNTARTERTSTA